MTTALVSRFAAAGLFAIAAVAATPAAAQRIDNSYICVFKTGAVARGQVQAEANRAVQAQGGEVSRVYTRALSGFAAHISAQGVANMRAGNSSIAYCEQDQVMRVPQPAAGRPGGGGGSPCAAGSVGYRTRQRRHRRSDRPGLGHRYRHRQARTRTST
jgi:hypothetical protein